MNAHTVRKVLPLVAAMFIAGSMFEALSQPYNISGYVRTSRGAGIAGVSMDGLPGPPLTDASGFYTATVDYRWSGTVTPSLTGYTFSPPSITYSNVTSNMINQNYTGTLHTFTISGHVRLHTITGEPIPGASMNGLPGPPLTDASGFYTATVEDRWSGTVTPSLPGFTFIPPSITYSNVTSHMTNQNYSATLQKFTISGRVRTSAGQSFPGVTLVGLPGPPLSDANGFYTATVEWGWNGEFSASFYGYLFQPLARKILFVIQDEMNQDFTGFPAVTVWGRDDMPHEYYLHQNNPSPFNPSTTIKYELPKSSDVRLSVYDMLGREVSVLVNQRRDAGVHEVTFDASGLSSGVYFYRLKAGDFVQTKKSMLLR